MCVKILRGDITKLEVDAIVNAAKTTLLGGGGVDGAIHAAAGPELLAECKTLNGCGVGKAKITKGYKLPAKYVIHTVGPIWRDGSHGEEQFLEDCYRNSLKLACEYNLHSIAFPAISTGIYQFPKRLAAEIAVKTIYDEMSKKDSNIEVFLVAFDKDTKKLYEEFMKKQSENNSL